jgi:hypothetical protein
MAQQGRGKLRAAEASRPQPKVEDPTAPATEAPGGAPEGWQRPPPLTRRGKAVLAGTVLLLNLPLLHALVRGEPEAPVALPFRDDFSRPDTLASHYWTMGGGLWRLEGGQLLSPGVKNNRLWLKARLPEDAVVEFDARTDTPGGDVRVELFGNGRDGTSRTDGTTQGTGYLFVHGGQRASQVVLARLDEKAPLRAGRDAQSAVRVEGSGPALVAGRTYRWRIEREGGRLRWSIDGQPVLDFEDPFPLRGRGHDRFALLSNQADVLYDNLWVGPRAGAPPAAPPPPPAPVLTAPFTDTFDRAALGEGWTATAPDAVRLEAGALVVEGALNRPVWLKQALPREAAIEFDAWTDSPEGDLKVEAWGDGQSFHTGDPRAQYTASGYVFVLGGWRNTASVLTWGNEHTPQRALRQDVRVSPGRRYHWRIVRQGGRVSWSLDGQPFLSMEDTAPAHRPGSLHFAFSGYQTRVHFDNLRIEPL